MTTPMPSNPDILQIAGNIILNEMGLSNDQIWIWNSKRNIPNDDKLYIVLSETSNELIANNKYYESDLTGLKEVQCKVKYRDWETDRKSTRLNSSHSGESRMPSSA